MCFQINKRKRKNWAWGDAQWAKCLMDKYEDLGFIPSTCTQPYTQTHTERHTQRKADTQIQTDTYHTDIHTQLHAPREQQAPT